jgi:hypothetical protein
MANVKTYNLSIYLVENTFTWRGISRVAVKRYIEYYQDRAEYCGNHIEAR